MRKKYTFYQWDNNPAVYMYSARDAAWYYNIFPGGKFFPNLLLEVKNKKPGRLCRLGEWLIVDMKTGEYFDDLKYLPIYEQPK